MKQRYPLALTISQLASAAALLGSWGRAPVWMYFALAAPLFFLLPLLLLKGKTARRLSVPFWMLFVVCFAAFWFYAGTREFFSFNEYSLTALVFFLLNTVFLIAAPRSKPNAFFGVRTPMTSESPEIWAKVHSVYSVVCAVFEIPLFLLIFYVPGMLKFILAVIFVLAASLGGAVCGQLAALPLLRELRRREEEERKAQIRKEQM